MHKTATAITGALLALGLATGAAAGEKANIGDSKAPKSETIEYVNNAQMAAELARYGNRAEDPMALITAARIMKQYPMGESDKLSDADSADGATKDGRLKLTPEAILARARELAGDRQDLVALADDVAAMSSRGRKGGGGILDTRVDANGTDVYEIDFEGGEPAQVGINGDNDTDLDLEVYDENGNLICDSTSSNDYETCEWTPRWTGMFRVEVHNLGDVWNGYRIVTN